MKLKKICGYLILAHLMPAFICLLSVLEATEPKTKIDIFFYNHPYLGGWVVNIAFIGLAYIVWLAVELIYNED
jgi:hypothetical protein